MPLNESIRRQLALTLDPPAETDELTTGCSSWSTPDGEVRVVVCEDRVGLVNLRDTASFQGIDLIGSSRETVMRLLGAPCQHDPVIDGLSFVQGQWELFIGFDPIAADRVSWVTLSHDDVLDGA